MTFNLKEKLLAFTPYNDFEAAFVEQMTQFLNTSDNPYCRSNLIAHICGDAWIVNPERTKILMLQHGDDGKWVGPGGHCDGSPDAYDATVREVEEETGIPASALTPVHGMELFDIGGMHKPTQVKYGRLEPEHLHLNACFLFEVSEDTPLQISHESLDMKWVTLEEASQLNVLGCHKLRIEKMQKGWMMQTGSHSSRITG